MRRNWVRNIKDGGNMEAMFSGSPEKVLKMECRCWVGPLPAKNGGSNTNRMALVVASTSLSFSTERITRRLTNSLFKSHFIRKINKSNLDPPLQQWRTRSRISFIMHNHNVVDSYKGVKRASFQLPLLLLPLRLGRSSSLPFLHKFISSPMSSLNSDANPDVKTVRAVIKGRVQGVFYRDWTVENAKELGLKGWVRGMDRWKLCFLEARKKFRKWSRGVGGVHHLLLSLD
ncbi:hypothetical protein H5410_044716 [Solanum commersonii]|uniref:Acylphosphatase-like domain-containing protein n=1 Tax=Solanum commersonii TaxID=4109 RepID=A0A9J5X8X0_SOLCO|nr:hypothetical protein H5410_044716 [Solanum commersonii]